jgi:hypothetical protein
MRKKSAGRPAGLRRKQEPQASWPDGPSPWMPAWDNTERELWGPRLGPHPSPPEIIILRQPLMPRPRLGTRIKPARPRDEVVADGEIGDLQELRQVSPDRLAQLPPLPADDVLLQSTQDILGESRPTSKGSSRAALAPRILRALIWIRRRTDEVISSWYSYSDEKAWLEFQIKDLELPVQGRAKLVARLEALEKEQRSNRRNRLRWLRSQYQEADIALSPAKRRTESMADGDDFQAWLTASAHQHVVRLKKGLSAKALNAEATGTPATSTDEAVPVLKNPEDAGLPEALDYLRLQLELPYRTIRKLLALYGLADATVGQLRVSVKRLRARL